MTTSAKRGMSGLALDAKSLPFQAISASGLGQNYPLHYPQSQGVNGLSFAEGNGSPLGIPLSIREVARMIGCSAWTVRQKHLPSGLPYFRSGPNGKLVFFREQVVAWVLEQQRKGGRL